MIQLRKRLLFLIFLAVCLSSGAVYAVDTDGDALADDVEATLGSSSMHKDIFVEVDYLIVNGRSMKPRPGMVDFVEEIFDAAPVNNPDGTTGIRIHINVSQGIKDNRSALGYMQANGAYNWSDFDAVKNRYFTPGYRNTHHYCLFIKDIGDQNGNPTGISGISRNGVNFTAGASDFIVSLGNPGWWNYPSKSLYKYTQAGTFVHELGHNIGLKHGGLDHTNYKPNYLSLMNYFFQVDGIPGTDGYSYYDYSRTKLSSLNEKKLNEAKGLGTPADGFGTYWYVYDSNSGFVQYEVQDATNNVDWSGNGKLDYSTKANINGDVANNQHVYTTLKGAEDWSRLVYTGGGNIGAGLAVASPPQTTSLRCLSFNEYNAPNRFRPPVLGYVTNKHLQKKQ